MHHFTIYSKKEKLRDYSMINFAIYSTNKKKTACWVKVPSYKISSTTFESGFAGSGFRIETGSASTLFTVDDLTVRGTMSVFELLIHQIRATNGFSNVNWIFTGLIISTSVMGPQLPLVKLGFSASNAFSIVY